jgi:hypothetical protein
MRWLAMFTLVAFVTAGQSVAQTNVGSDSFKKVLDKEQGIIEMPGDTTDALPRESDRNAYSWNKIDCENIALRGGLLILSADGKSRWQAKMSSSSGRRTWYMQFHLFSSDDFPLYVMPPQQRDAWFFFEVPEGQTEWKQDQWVFDPSKFPYINKVSMRWRCQMN